MIGIAYHLLRCFEREAHHRPDHSEQNKAQFWKSTPAVDNKLNEIYGTKYLIKLDHQMLTDHGVFYSKALYNDHDFEVTLVPVSQVVKGSDVTKL